MKIDKRTIYDVIINEVDYIRFPSDNWMSLNSNGFLENEYYSEELEEQFQETLKIQKDIGMI